MIVEYITEQKMESPENEPFQPVPKNYLQTLTQRRLISDYKQNLRHFLLTSRFNNQTWSENSRYRDTHKQIKCIYCSPDPISRDIPVDAVAFVLEMNNDTNIIMGIGMISNHSQINRYRVYKEGNYNRYNYVGKGRIDRTQMTADEERIMKVFDILCFTGNTHMKRGQGLKLFPVDMLYRCSVKLDLVEFVSEMFKNRLLHR